MIKKSKEIIFIQFRVVVNLFSGEVCDGERAQRETSGVLTIFSFSIRVVAA